MHECNFPLIVCRLTNKNGEILNPFAPNALSFTRLCSSRKREEKDRRSHNIRVLISGYIVVYVEGRNLSSPIPFKMVKQMQIVGPDSMFLEFQTRKFQCTATPVILGTAITEVEITIDLKAVARSCCWADILIQPVTISEQILICAREVYDYVCLDCRTTVPYEMHIRSLVSQYNALSDGIKKNYTNADELTEYGHTGIITPSDHTLYSLFVNGVLNPKVNYEITTGNLDLLTEDVPPRNATLVISFVTLGQNNGSNVTAIGNSYVTRSTGSKRVFLDSDELTEYGDQGIPSPDQVSFYNLFINGALQPKTNYAIRRGSLELLTTDIPPDREMITLEYFTIRDDNGTLLRADVYEYNARSSGNKIYTNADEITMYDNQGIPDPNLYSFKHLFVNGVMQPDVNYSVKKGMLTIKTINAPSMDAPITLQLVCIFTS